MKDLIAKQHFTDEELKTLKNNSSWSCDTFVIMADVSEEEATILSKNSDRVEYDAQPLMYYPKKTYGPHEKLKLGNVTIDQVEETYEHLGSSPYWCWGYEEGINVHGVAIGNEAIFTKDVAEKMQAVKDGEHVEYGIIGMEFIRLGLERAKTAREAVNVITGLLAEYGQFSSGNPAVQPEDGAYDNSFIIADKDESYVLETVGKHFMAKRVSKGTTAISNEPSIRTEWDLASDGIIDYAIEKGWWEEERRSEFDFAKAFLDFEKPLQLSHIRVQRMKQLLKEGLDNHQGQIGLPWSRRIMRDHYEDTFLEGPYMNAALPDFLTVCMHHSPAEFTWGNTASSSQFILPKEKDRFPVMWWLAGVPCTGVYIPFYPEAGPINPILSKAGTYGKHAMAPQDAAVDSYKEDSFWWIMRDLLETAKRDAYGEKFNVRQPIIREVYNDLERKWLLEAKNVEEKAMDLKLKNDEGYKQILSEFSDKCVMEALETTKNLKDMIQKV
ncbi:C69 family dipeptidase [Oceanobacillus jeddahense]|uniref:C69 family dipeptidase n=1 Tax=Oceanobacillus jeddahense TaxID=1462527 RepID=UPI0036367FBB